MADGVGAMVADLDVGDIAPSPYQNRRAFGADALKELAKSIERDGLIEPIVVRPKSPGWELIAGERRLRAVRDYGNRRTILARIVEASDLQARRMGAAENLQRQDLSAVETVEALVELIDAELAEELEYLALGDSTTRRVTKLLTDLQNSQRGLSNQADMVTDKFVRRVEAIFGGLPRPVDWRTFYAHDLRLVTNLDEDVRDESIAKRLNKSQAKALNRLKREAPSDYQALTKNRTDDGTVILPRACQEEPGDTLADLPARGLKPLARGMVVVERRSDPQETQPLPDGIFSVILADPPWRYDFSRDRADAIEAHYSTMSLEDICGLKDQIETRTAPDCVLFLWATMPKLPEALTVIDKWGFTYKTGSIWSKQGPPGLGYYWRIDHELLLLATKGTPGVPEPRDRISSIIPAPKGRHSAKPSLFHQMIERMYPNARRLELFARSERPEWSVWGNQADGGPEDERTPILEGLDIPRGEVLALTSLRLLDEETLATV